MVSQKHSTQPASSRTPLAGAMAELSQLLLDTNSFHDLMVELAELAARTIPAVKTCAITMANGGRVITVGAADSLAAQLDEQQYALDEGPCLQALHDRQIVDAPDLSRENRWDGYPQAALSLGIAAIYSSPLIAGERAVGVLNLYADHLNAFDDVSRQLTAELVTVTALAIAATLRNYGDITLTDQLQEALNSRSIIDQAIGILVATQHVPPTEAFAVLRRQSQNSNTRLTTIAQQLVDGYTRAG